MFKRAMKKITQSESIQGHLERGVISRKVVRGDSSEQVTFVERAE